MIVKRRTFNRISWGAVFAGVIVAMVVQLLLSLLGLAIGFGNINPMTEANPFAGLGTPALIWWVVSILLALFAGGLAAGRLSGLLVPFDRMLHGFLTFSVYSIVTFFMITTAVGGIISGVGNLVGKSLSYAGQDQELRQRAEEMVENFRQRAAGSSPEDTLRRYEPEIRSTSEDIASTAGRVSLFAFIGLILGAVAASAGSGVGRPKKEDADLEIDDTYNDTDTDLRRDTYIKRDPGIRREAEVRRDYEIRRDPDDLRRDPDIRRDADVRRDYDTRKDYDTRRDYNTRRKDPDVRRSPDDINRDPDDIRRDPNIRRDPDDIRRDPDDIRRDPDRDI